MVKCVVKSFAHLGLSFLFSCGFGVGGFFRHLRLESLIIYVHGRYLAFFSFVLGSWGERLHFRVLNLRSQI